MQPNLISPVVDYASAIKYLLDRINYEKVGQKSYSQKNFRLARMHRILAALNNPHRRYPIVHIAGTKGKGSVAWLIAQSLRYSGLRVGLYTSPHLIHLEERFVVDGSPCSQQQLVDCINAIHPIAEMLLRTGEGETTFFEFTTAIGFLLFANEKVDVAVVEVGLGGRLDSTNVCAATVSVITSISFDHQQQLGHTIPAIAQEKAGIIKPRTPVVSGVLDEEAKAVIQRKALESGSELRQLGDDFFVRVCDTSDPQAVDHSLGPMPLHSPRPTLIRYGCDTKKWPGSKNRDELALMMTGVHQANNAATAIAALDVLAEKTNLQIDDRAIAKAMATTQVPARAQFIPGKVPLVLDSAHNLASIAALLTTLDSNWPRRSAGNGVLRVIVYAASSDKDYEKLIELLLPACDELILTQYHTNPRAVEFQTLKEVANRKERELVAAALERKESLQLARTHGFASPAEALRKARALASNRGLICVTGSFFLAAEIIPLLRLDLLPQG